ncbi:hypothetical protein HQ576_12460 [bacterium]|nr:hypothetical protein [bacterium]
MAHAGTHGVDQYNVTWMTPSKTSSGSMPLGNGDIGLNVWVEEGGDLLFYLSKTDAWDDNARLVKIGRVRIHLEPNPFAAGQPFRQTLSLRDATLKVQAAEGPRRTAVQVWVDANQPVIHVAVESASPLVATGAVELWRTERQEYKQLQCSDIMTGAPPARRQPTIIEPDTVLTGQQGRIGWYHHNAKSFGPKLLAEIQGLTEFGQKDPLLHRTFGAVVKARGGKRVDDLHLLSPSGTAHQFSIYVLTTHPSTPQQWLAEMDKVIGRVEAEEHTARRAAHERWWAGFWDRSWIRARLAPGATAVGGGPVPANALPVRIGIDPAGGNRYAGELARVRIFGRALSDAEIEAAAKQDGEPGPTAPAGLLFSGSATGPVADSAGWSFAKGMTVEVRAKPEKLPGGGARLVDKITPGGSDGFLLDTFPGNSLRFICGPTQLTQPDALPAGRWTHVAAVADPSRGCRLYVDGKLVSGDAMEAVHDEADFVSRMYHLQRFINACGGRGQHPIKYNGSIFTVPLPDGKSDPDYRRWGPGYWWQNTRLPYFSMPASGDYDLMQPLFRMYADDLLELCKFRTRLYCGHGGAYYPECIYFWGPMFSETYGWQPWDQRADKLQASRWHKWEWVCGPELCWLMLDHYEHTLDDGFLRKTLLPFAHETLTFFEQHYKTDDQGKLVMHPSQACETWWECTNPMPEVAGCIAVTERLLALPADATPKHERELWQRLHDKLPPLPTRDVNGKTALAPAAKFAMKRNIENPELYAVFPFRLIAVEKPHLDWGIVALEHRWDRGHAGWRQDDLFMAFMGLTDATRKAIVSRARRHDTTQRFPAFWGPNYDWTPDQTHGGVLLRTFQTMLLQTDGRRILLLPAWPKDWEADFKLHAPYQTTVEGRVRGGRLAQLRVVPEARRKDVTILNTTQTRRRHTP